MPREVKRCRYGFKRNDIVLTPTHRRATLTHYRNDELWDATYLDDPYAHSNTTVLNPKYMVLE